MGAINRRQFMGLAAGFTASVLSGSLDGLVSRVFAEDETDQKVVDQMLGNVIEIVNNGPKDKRINFVVASEGYVKKDEFVRDVQTIIAEAKKRRVLDEYGGFVNWTGIWVPSKEVWDPTSENKGTPFQMNTMGGMNLLFADNSVAYDSFETAAKKINAHMRGVMANSEKAHGNGGLSFLSTKYPETFLHESFGHGLGELRDEYADLGEGFNASRNPERTPWKSLEGKIPGIKTTEVVKGFYRGEEANCLMKSTNKGMDFGPLCSSNIALEVRKIVRPIYSAPSEAATIDRKTGNQLNLEILTNRSKNYSPDVLAYYRSGDAAAMDKLAADFREKVPTDGLARDYFKAKKGEWKPVSLAAKKGGYVMNSILPEGNHVVVVVANDPNPAILLNNKDIEDKRVYRVDVGSDKLGMK